MADGPTEPVSTTFVLAYCPDGADPLQSIAEVQASMVDAPAQQMTAVAPGSDQALAMPSAKPGLSIDGVFVELDPDRPNDVYDLLDFVFRVHGLEARKVIWTALDRASEGRLREGEPLRDAVTKGWQMLFAGIGGLLDVIDASARVVLREEIDKARELALLDKIGLTISKDNVVTIADQGVFDDFKASLRSLLRERDELRQVDKELEDANSSLESILDILFGPQAGDGSDPRQSPAGELRDRAYQAYQAKAKKYGSDLSEAAKRFPVVWRLNDDLTVDPDDSEIRGWAVGQLTATGKALGELFAGGVERRRAAFGAAADPVAAVLDDAGSAFSVWQYPRVISMGCERVPMPPGSLGWIAAMEILAQRARPNESDSHIGWLFDAAWPALIALPVVGEAAALISLLVAAWRAYEHITEAEHQQTAHLAALDPMSSLAVPDVDLTLVVLLSLAGVGLSLFGARKVLAPILDTGVLLAKRFVIASAVVNRVMLSGPGVTRIGLRLTNPGIVRLADSARAAADRDLRAFLAEAEEVARAKGTAAAEEWAQRLAKQGVHYVAPSATATSVASAAAGASSPAGGAAGQALNLLASFAGMTSAAAPGAPGSTTRTTAPERSRAPAILDVLNSPALLAAAARDLQEIARRFSPAIAKLLETEQMRVTSAMFLLLQRGQPYYSGTAQFLSQFPDKTFEKLVPGDANGYRTFLVGKLNEILIAADGRLRARLMEIALAGYRQEPSGLWSYPVVSEQARIDAGEGAGMRDAQDMIAVSYGMAKWLEGYVRVWAWAEIKTGSPAALLAQHDSAVWRLRQPNARLEIDGRPFDVFPYVIWGRGKFSSGSPTMFIGAVHAPVDPAAVPGFVQRGIDPVDDILGFQPDETTQMGWSRQELWNIVTAFLSRYGIIGH
jgi:hypothetical protein